MASFEAFTCDACKGLFARSQRSCRRCGASAILPVNLSGRGLLTSFTTIRMPPTAFQGQEPYDIAVIDLEEGLRVTARLTVQAGRTAGIGDPVMFETMCPYGAAFRLIEEQE
ncbi:OB-fold domain-containing protein [Candidatus Methylomirabilis sp.]|uniref:OB-fold domain-containing protein n=1 Tax=Candidatus Methylomirabilis tolerans TaxID=3123416 RepID=A0AAJ1AG60_9BACT|nr:OB-fold domain-containing protein [Candidatus Methylomirabilis sp.]